MATQAVTFAANNQQIVLTALPLGPSGTTARRIYRSLGTGAFVLVATLNDNTTTAGKLFSDPKLYDNLTGLTGDMRLLIGDFRQNPKKFLRIKVALF